MEIAGAAIAPAQWAAAVQRLARERDRHQRQGTHEKLTRADASGTDRRSAGPRRPVRPHEIGCGLDAGFQAPTALGPSAARHTDDALTPNLPSGALTLGAGASTLA